jgi:hypothetical protein
MRESAGFAGANATDGQGKDITSSVLACPAATCASFRCPSNKFSPFGLDACALDTSRMPVGSEVTIAFAVYDGQKPPKDAHKIRILRIASPCQPSSIHCPGLSQQCGSSPCTVRAALLGSGNSVEGASAETHLHFSSNLTVPAVSELVGESLHVSWPCSALPPLDLAVCTNDTSSCFVYASPNAVAGRTFSVWAPLLSTENATQFCSVAALSVGACPAGNHTVEFQGYLGNREESNRASLILSLGTPIASFAVTVSVQLLVPPRNVSSALTTWNEELHGGSFLTSWLLRDASKALKAALQAFMCQGILAIDALDVDICRSGARVIFESSPGALQVCFQSMSEI